MSKKSDYQKTIAYFAHDVPQKDAYRIINLDDPLRDVVKRLYYGYIASGYVHHSPAYLAFKLDKKQLKEYIDGIKKIFATHHIDTEMVLPSFEQFIQDHSIDDYKSVFQEINSNPPSDAKKKKTKPQSIEDEIQAPKKVAKPKQGARKKCKDFTVVQLKAMSKDAGMTGYSKLKKADLCDNLKIK